MGGSATRASNLATGLSLNGCNVTVITAFPHYPHGVIPRQYQHVPIKEEWMGKAKVIRTFVPPVRSEGFFKRLVLIGSFAISSLFALPWVGKIDAIWASSWTPGYIYGKLKRVPVAENVDDLTLEDLVDLKLMNKASFILKVATVIYRTFYAKGNVITPISSGYSGTISNKYCVDLNRICEIRIGVNVNIFRKSTSFSHNGKFRVVYTGILGLGYDFDQILNCAKVLAGKGENVEFVLHGIGESLPEIKKKIKELKLTNVQLSNQILKNREDVTKILNAADAFILPMRNYGHRYLGLPTKLYEYQAVGKPIICCCEGVPSDYITETNSGLIVNPGDYETLATTIINLKNNPELTYRLGENGRRHVESEESIEAIGLKTKNLLVSLT